MYVYFLAFLFLFRMTHLTGFKPVISHKLWTDCAYLLIKFLNICSFHIKWIHFFFLGCYYGSSKAGWGTNSFGTFLNRRLTENYSSWGTNINFNYNRTESSTVELFGYIMWCSPWIDWACRSVQCNSWNVPRGHCWIYQVQNELILILMFKF